MLDKANSVLSQVKTSVHLPVGYETRLSDDSGTAFIAGNIRTPSSVSLYIDKTGADPGDDNQFTVEVRVFANKPSAVVFFREWNQPFNSSIASAQTYDDLAPIIITALNNAIDNIKTSPKATNEQENQQAEATAETETGGAENDQKLGIDPVAKANIEAADISAAIKKKAITYLEANPTSHKIEGISAKSLSAIMESIKTALFAEIKALSPLFNDGQKINSDNSASIQLGNFVSLTFRVDEDKNSSTGYKFVGISSSSGDEPYQSIFDSSSTLEDLRLWDFALPFDLDVKAFVANVIKPVVDEFLSNQGSDSNISSSSSDAIDIENLTNDQVIALSDEEFKKAIDDLEEVNHHTLAYAYQSARKGDIALANEFRKLDAENTVNRPDSWGAKYTGLQDRFYAERDKSAMVDEEPEEPQQLAMHSSEVDVPIEDRKALKDTVLKKLKPRYEDGAKLVKTKNGDEILVAWNGLKHAMNAGLPTWQEAIAALHIESLIKQADYLKTEPDKAGRADPISTTLYQTETVFDDVPHTVIIFARNHSDGNRYYDHVTVEKKSPVGLTESDTDKSISPTLPFAGLSDENIPQPTENAIGPDQLAAGIDGEAVREGQETEELTPDGLDNEVKTAKGTKVVTGFMVIEASKLIISHDEQGNANPDYPAELQPRDRARDTSQLQITKIANNLDPDMLGRTRVAYQGAPIVGKDGVVESGNGRAMGITLAYKLGKADEYRAWLLEVADMYGLSETKIKAMKRPVLVRVRKTEIDRVQFAMESNQSDMLAMTGTEKAKSDANRLTDAIIGKLSIDGDLTAASNRDFITAFLQALGDDETAGLLTTSGQPTKQLYDRAQAAILTATCCLKRMILQWPCNATLK